jgi:hypothetical protein
MEKNSSGIIDMGETPTVQLEVGVLPSRQKPGTIIFGRKG